MSNKIIYFNIRERLDFLLNRSYIFTVMRKEKEKKKKDCFFFLFVILLYTALITRGQCNLFKSLLFLSFIKAVKLTFFSCSSSLPLIFHNYIWHETFTVQLNIIKWHITPQQQANHLVREKARMHSLKHPLSLQYFIHCPMF